MDEQALETLAFLTARHPYDALPGDERARVAEAMQRRDLGPHEPVYTHGEPLDGLYVVLEGTVEVRDPAGNLISLLGRGNSFGERGLLVDGRAATTAKAMEEGARLLLLPAERFSHLMAAEPAFRRFFDRSRPDAGRVRDLAGIPIAELMSPSPIACGPDDPARRAAALMAEHNVSCVLVTDGEARLVGMLTTGDLARRVIAAGLSPDTPVREVMTARPLGLPPSAIGTDVLHQMLERRIGHLPVVDEGKPVGIVTQSDLTRHQAVSSGQLVAGIVGARDVDALAAVVARVPELLARLVEAGNRHDVTTRLVTDVADAATRRLLRLAEAELGPPPVPYLWLACGSQGRQEQTGVSDQDNCLFIDDAVTEADAPWFAALAEFVCSGLARCGYVLCPGEMMATNPRWRQPVATWREYFRGWIARPDPMAQMLASVMFDLRAIGGETTLLEGVITETLEEASRNSIFLAHMIANSVGHTPPLGLLGKVATIRSGEHKNTVDLKLQGVVPVVDLARVYAIRGRIQPVNTRLRLCEAAEAGIVSESGGRDLLAAYDLIADTRLQHQAACVRAGRRPDNYVSPSSLTDLDRSHLRNAFVVVKTMQSALGYGRSAAL